MLPQDQFSTAFCEAFGDIELELPHLEQKSPDQSAQRELAGGKSRAASSIEEQ